MLGHLRNTRHQKIVRPKGPKLSEHSKKKKKLRGKSIINKVLRINTTSRGSLGCLGSFIRFNFLINNFEVQIFRVYSWTMLHQVPPEQLEPLEVPTK